MSRGLWLLVLLACPAVAGKVDLYPGLPGSPIIQSVQVDASGNIYLAGSVAPPTPRSENETDAFVAKLTPDGARVLFYTVLSGAGIDTAAALTIGSDGSAYVTGGTTSTDFPVTAGAVQSSYTSTDGGIQGFVTKLDANGAIRYSTYLAGTNSGQGIMVDAAGNAYVTGGQITGFTATPGTVSGRLGGFVVKLDAAGSKLLLAVSGAGGSFIATDVQGNIYIAGTGGGPVGDFAPGATPGAFQPGPRIRVCSGGSGIGGFQLACSYPFVAKLDPAGTKFLYATYLTGTYGAKPAAMAVDAAGNVIVAGTTNSPDYPVTPGAFQTSYSANAAPPPDASAFPPILPPPPTGYVTKLNASGSGLVWSTFFGGMRQDYVTGMTVDQARAILLAGYSESGDLPGLSQTPTGCRPTLNQPLAFVARLSADGSGAGSTQLIHGVHSCLYGNCFYTVFTPWWPALRSDGTVVVASARGELAGADLTAAAHLACLTDPADNVQVRSVAPGQVLSIFGDDIAPTLPKVPAIGLLPGFNGVNVTFNGFAATILYTSGQQIDVQVPYEIAGAATVEMRLSSLVNGAFSESQTLAVAARQPSVFLAPDAFDTDAAGTSFCGNRFQRVPQAVALNPDGTRNDCANPAPSGSIVTIFLNGLGTTTPAQSTGAVSMAPPIALSPSVDSGPMPTAAAATYLSTTTLPGAVSGVAQVRIQLPPNVPNGYVLVPVVAGTATRQAAVLVWMK
jgi:uncharacterized protein (TIGR03437 family)